MKAKDITIAAQRTLNTSVRYETIKGEARITVELEEGDTLEGAAQFAQDSAIEQADLICQRLLT